MVAVIPTGVRQVALGAVDLYVGLSAIGGGLGLLLHAYEMPLGLLEGPPFTSYTVPAPTLAAAVGGSATVVGFSVLLYRT